MYLLSPPQLTNDTDKGVIPLQRNYPDNLQRISERVQIPTVKCQRVDEPWEG